MTDFQSVYEQLNRAQKQAVDKIDGPLLVLAGPGTGKTQLLSARVARILEETDALPQSILCLTFTDSAARNMRDRLSSFIGKDAHDVYISTYHTFGSDIIKSYPEYFDDINLQRPIDELKKRQILNSIVESLPYGSPLKSTRYHLGDLISTVSELKRGLYTPKKLNALAQKNDQQIQAANKVIRKTTSGIKTFPSSFAKADGLYSSMIDGLVQLKLGEGLVALAVDELEAAYEDAAKTNKSSPLTKWKNKWLHKSADNEYVFTDSRLTEKAEELGTVLQLYNNVLTSEGYYDFDDMIIRSIEAIKKNDELKFNLQERFQYVLLDEFQDTNTAQFELVKQLADNPVHEGSPNVMAVGDDDQAIYAFQGAKFSNMVDFSRSFKDVSVINLTDNYRSHPKILHVAHNIAEQIESRLHHQLEGVNKLLKASSQTMSDDSELSRHEFVGPSEEYSWVATQIKKMIKAGEDPREIAVIAPKHKYLEAQVTYLNELNIPVTYEKRENVLKTPIIRQLRAMVETVIALSERDRQLANKLLPEVLSYEFFEISPEQVWQINWQLKRGESWAKLAVANEKLAKHVWLFLSLATQTKTRTLESIIDVLSGVEVIEIKGEVYRSPLRDFYFSPDAKHANPLLYYETLSHLSVIREKLREYQNSQDDPLGVEEFITLFELYEEAEQSLINTHPIAQDEKSVPLLTVYKAKGLEFNHVFVLGCQDEVWGMRARDKTNKLTLPANLKYIRHAGANEDERLRLFFVAVTRARRSLYLTSHATDLGGRKTTSLKFMNESENTSAVMPDDSAKVNKTTQDSLEAKQASVELGWHKKHSQINPKLHALLEQRLERYQLSPTHLNTFIDLEYGGPEVFLLSTLLRFPQAPSVDGEYGSAIHETLDWYQRQIINKAKPSIDEVSARFDKQLAMKYIMDSEKKLLRERGHKALSAFLSEKGNDFSADDLSEHDFKREGVVLGEVQLIGMIDKLIVDKKNKTIEVVDYKTGASSRKWYKNPKLYKYRQQLIMYKLLVEGSHSFKGYKVNKGRLDFVEPNDDGEIITLELEYEDREVEQLKTLIQAVWQSIMTLNLPDVSEYPVSMKGIEQFVKDLTK